MKKRAFITHVGPEVERCVLDGARRNRMSLSLFIERLLEAALNIAAGPSLVLTEEQIVASYEEACKNSKTYKTSEELFDELDRVEKSC